MVHQFISSQLNKPYGACSK